MAELTEVPTANAAQLGASGLKNNLLFRQLAVMVGIAASVAIGVAVVLWSQSPNYSPLYGSLAEKDAMEVVTALQQVGVDYKVEQATGMVLVPNGKLQEIRMQLAAQGLPHSDGLGFEMLQQDTGFGTSQLVESARYHHALEGELARTIATISGVQTARVHLALPKQSVFVRKRNPPSASVTLKLYAGRVLEQGQVEAILHLVASSVPEMEPGRVTIVDHKGRLLSDERGSREMKLSATQFEYTRKVEEHYRKRIEDLLVPIVGGDSVRAQVTADMDFTVTEQTQERFNPDQPALRSEQLNEEASRLGAVQGVPGALSNQPPAAGSAPQQAQEVADAADAAEPLNTSKQATRNYELDRVVSHTRMAPASLRRLSVAVVVDDVVEPGAEGAVVRRERTPEEVERITQLVREAIGYDARRGDSVKVINSSFLPPEPIEALPEPALWENAWFWDVLKQVGGVLVAILVIFGVLRPTMKRLMGPAVVAQQGAGATAAALGADAAGEAGGEQRPMLDKNGEPVRLPGPAGYENVLDAARGMVDSDPKRVAQLVKTWIAEDAA
jgi:flagellar M-ring protein FliF